MPRHHTQQTSIDAFRAGDWAPLEARMLAAIMTAGEQGITLDDMLDAFPGHPGTTLSSSIGHLVRDGKVFRRGDTRLGTRPGSRRQLITRDIALAPDNYMPPSEVKKTGFAAGLAYAKKIFEQAGEFASGIQSLNAEIRKQEA